MPGKSRGLSKVKAAGRGAAKPKRGGAVAAPFSPAIAKKATDVAARYQVILEEADDRWYGRGLELPHIFADGPTPDACVEATRQAMSAAVAYLLESGQLPPAAARAAKRTQQVNVRLTAEEKSAIEASARNKGFSGLSDYLRAAALEATKHAPAKRRGRRAS